MTTPAISSHRKENRVASSVSILIYGYGNPGRQDDGLGPAFVEALEQWSIAEPGVQLAFETNYQLNAEDALTIAGHPMVIFVDATALEGRSFSFRRLLPQSTITFSTHAMPPESVLALCEELYDKHPVAYLLTIRGLRWEPNDPMTPEAEAHLAEALLFIKQFLKNPKTVDLPQNPG